MGGAIASVAMLATFLLVWWKVASVMKRGGIRGWISHLAASVLAFMASLGIASIALGIGLLAPAPGQDDGGVDSIIDGLILLAPLLGVYWWSRPPKLKKQVPAHRKDSAKRARPAKPSPKQAEKRRRAGLITQAALKTDVDVINQSGNLRFVYEDAQGKLSTRELSSWRDDGKYLEGYCHTAGDIRTFRRDRVIEFLTGEDQLGPVVYDPPYSEPAFRDYSMEALFTGMPASERTELEELAIDAGMTVRTRVTKNLNILVTGPKAGPSKIDAAREQGCLLLTPNQFRRLLETGEVPGNPA